MFSLPPPPFPPGVLFARSLWRAEPKEQRGEAVARIQVSDWHAGEEEGRASVNCERQPGGSEIGEGEGHSLREVKREGRKEERCGAKLEPGEGRGVEKGGGE